jgi:two-component system cell cycle sensor histidine kinase/response regulator CckA
MLMASNQQPAPKTILVVDDELSVLTVVKCMLECDDYSVLMANSAEAALRLIERKDLAIDLMITDVVMPDVNGRELVERALAIRPHVKVLFMSGYTDSEVVRVKVLDRTAGFLPKPFTSADIQEQVRKALAAPLHQSAAAGADTFAFYRSLTTERN